MKLLICCFVSESKIHCIYCKCTVTCKEGNVIFKAILEFCRNSNLLKVGEAFSSVLSKACLHIKSCFKFKLNQQTSVTPSSLPFAYSLLP